MKRTLAFSPIARLPNRLQRTDPNMLALFFPVVLALLFVIAFATNSIADTNASQTFRLAVPSSSTVTPPSQQTITATEIDGDLTFAPQTWIVQGNAMEGIVVDFGVQYAFRHTDDPTLKNDALLEVAIASTTGVANWTVNKSSDATNVNLNDEEASVQIASDGVGVANVELSVTFKYDPQRVLASGPYELTLMSTISLP